MDQDEFDRVFRERVQKIDDLQKWHNRMRVRLAVLKAVILFFGGLLIPPPWNYIAAVAIVVWALIRIVGREWPGRCLVCKKITTFGLPNDPTQIWPWWSQRRPGGRPRYWTCTEHFPVVVGYAASRAVSPHTPGASQ